MSSSSLRIGLLVLSLAPIAVACSAAGDDVSDGDDVSEAEANVARITPGEFKMYDQPRATPDPSCDVHTKLSLTADRGSRAKLEEVVGGPCEIAVFPNPREYRLRLDETSCGSKIYTGSIRRNGERNTLKITDHRTRTCRDLVPAKIITEEFTGNGFAGPVIRKLYSLDAAPAAQTITVDGTLKSVVGIGGESTGRAILSSAGSFELVLDANERGDFVSGRQARVTGTRIT